MHGIFISATLGELIGLALLFGLSLMALGYGLRLLLRPGHERPPLP